MKSGKKELLNYSFQAGSPGVPGPGAHYCSCLKPLQKASRK